MREASGSSRWSWRPRGACPVSAVPPCTGSQLLWLPPSTAALAACVRRCFRGWRLSAQDVRTPRWPADDKKRQMAVSETSCGRLFRHPCLLKLAMTTQCREAMAPLQRQQVPSRLSRCAVLAVFRERDCAQSCETGRLPSRVSKWL